MKNRKRMNKSIISLSLGIIRKNKMLTIGFLSLFIVLTALCIAANFSFTSISGSMDRFMEDYHLPDAMYYTDNLPVSFLENEVPEGVKSIEAGLAMDIHVKDSSGYTTCITMFSMEEDGFRKYHRMETAETPEGEIPVWFTKRFADSNHIKAGDKVTVRCLLGEMECFVESLASRPEAMFCTRNEFSWLDASEYGYMYIRRSDLESVFGFSGAANAWAVLFDDSLSESEEDELFKTLEDSFGGSLKQSIQFREYLKTMKITDDLKQAEGISVYVPLLCYLIGLCFSWLFIYLIIQQQRKDIGFLMSLGYTEREIFRVFLQYCLTVGIIGIMIGCVLGTCIVKYSISVAQNSYSIPQMYYIPTLARFIVTISLQLLIAFLSCLLCVRNITRVEPAEAFGGTAADGNIKIPRRSDHKKHNPFIRFSSALAFKNRKRLIISSLSIASCIMLIFIGLEYNASNAAVEGATFGERFRYDYLVQFQNGREYINEAEKVDGVSGAEEITAFIADVSTSEVTEKNVRINAISNDSTLIVLKDKNGNRVDPGDGIIMDEKLAEMLSVSEGDMVFVDGAELRVTAVARERANSILYISTDTARGLGYTSPNQLAVKCEQNADMQDVRNAFDSIRGFSGITALENQRADMRKNDKTINALSYVVIVLMFALGSILIYIMVVLGIEDNKRDYAILNALGVKTGSLMTIALLENLLMYAAAVLIGIPGGILACRLLFPYMGSLVKYFPPTQIGTVCIKSCILALGYLAFGIGFSVYKAIRVDPAKTLQT